MSDNRFFCRLTLPSKGKRTLNMPTKANSRMIVRGRKGRPMSIKSKVARDWMQHVRIDALAAMNFRPPMQGPVVLEIGICAPDNRADNDTSLLQDALQGIVYVNDRQVMSLHVTKVVEREHPRVEVSVTPIMPESVWALTRDLHQAIAAREPEACDRLLAKRDRIKAEQERIKGMMRKGN